jgi:hypothetical protein
MEKNYKRKMLVIGVLFLFLGAGTTMMVSADRAWFDNFDSYLNGQLLDGTADDGGWEGWAQAPAAAGMVTDAQARSYPYSDQVWAATDNVHQYEGYTTGVWAYTAWQYIPTDFSGETYFIMMDTYDEVAGAGVWSIQVHFNSETDLVVSDFALEQLPLIQGRWVEIRCIIDFETDWLQIYYDNELLAEHAWTDTTQGSGGGTLNIACVDLFANAASPVYYDDMSLDVYTAALTCDAGGPYVNAVGNATNFAGVAHGGTEPYTYLWNFGDGNTSTDRNPTHTYGAVDLYDVTLTVTDSARAQVVDTATVNITGYVPPPPEPILGIGEITGGTGTISAVIANTGDGAATNVDWTIKVTGGIFKRINKTYTGDIATLDANGSQTITTTGKIFGLGKIAITITATCTEGSDDEVSATGKILIIFIKI